MSHLTDNYFYPSAERIWLCLRLNNASSIFSIRLTNFCSQKLKRRILATFGFNRTALRATEQKLDLMFFFLFLKIALSAAKLMSLDYYLWGVVKDKCCADKSEIIDASKDNIREAIGEIQLHTIDNMLKNWTDRVGYCMEWNYFPLLTGRIKNFPKKKKLFGELYIWLCKASLKYKIVSLFGQIHKQTFFTYNFILKQIVCIFLKGNVQCILQVI